MSKLFKYRADAVDIIRVQLLRAYPENLRHCSEVRKIAASIADDIVNTLETLEATHD